MKKITVLLLVISILTLTSCGLFQNEDTALDVAGICAIAKKAVPTTVITEVNLRTSAGDSLSGYYTTVTDGKDAIFTYSYQRFATPEDSVESGKPERISTFNGVINYRDGVYYGDEENWRPGTGTAYDLKFNVSTDLFTDAAMAEDGVSFNAKISKDNLVAMLGTDLNAIGDADVEITTNGKNLTMIEISCLTANGKLTLRTSYTYNVQDNLFPEVEEEN